MADTLKQNTLYPFSLHLTLFPIQNTQISLSFHLLSYLA